MHQLHLVFYSLFCQKHKNFQKTGFEGKRFGTEVKSSLIVQVALRFQLKVWN